MIVVDTNAIVYLLLGGPRTAQARAAFGKDSAWLAPLLWRSEFRSVLALYLHRGQLDLGDALRAMHLAEDFMEGGEYAVTSADVLSLVVSSRCSAYDCEFVALARELGVSLVTSDAQVLADFPDTAVSLDRFGSV
ncbi:MAG: type II toxin-antitoxin system VapC family toxin [Gemmatimonadetes bacterium]|nr:type II toxin-antitoxin system VapC family toxin [Gemmatimonadota bacterium]